MNSGNKTIAAFASGFIFAIGLGLGGMTQPSRVLGFLDVLNWDPTLMFVMIGAITVHGLTYPLVRRRRSPLLDPEWHVPKKTEITAKLVAGAALFGIGWGLAGYCPGPGIVSVASGNLAAAVFVTAMIAGLFVARKTFRQGP